MRHPGHEMTADPIFDFAPKTALPRSRHHVPEERNLAVLADFVSNGEPILGRDRTGDACRACPAQLPIHGPTEIEWRGRAVRILAPDLRSDSFGTPTLACSVAGCIVCSAAVWSLRLLALRP